MELIIKRYRGGSYNETDIICDKNGKELTRRQNLASRVKYGTNKIIYKGVTYKVTWERFFNIYNN